MAFLDRIVRSIRAVQSHVAAGRALRLPTILSLRERLALTGGIAACMVGIVLIVVGTYRSATVERPAIGGTYVEGIVGNPHLINPMFAPANEVDRDLVRLLFSGLFTVDANGRLVLDLAESYVVSTDGTSMTIALRADARWHDGAEVTADDVVFTVRLLQDATVASPLRTAFRGVTVERVDDHTVRFAIDRPFTVFANALTVGLLPAHLWSNIPPAHLALAELNTRPIGSGPFQFVGLTKDKRGTIRSYTLERYARYHGGAPYLGRIVFKFFEELDAVTAALDGREIDGFGALTALTEHAVRRRDVTKYPAPLPNTMAVFLNGRRSAVLRDLTVRRALDLAIDRNAIVTLDLNGAGTAVGGPVIPGFMPEAAPPAPTAIDLTAAGERLDRAKWERVEPDAYVRTRTQAELQALSAEKQKQLPKIRGRTPPAPEATEEERKTIEDRVRAELAPCEGCTPLPYIRVKSGQPLTITLTTADRSDLVAIATRVRNAWRSLGIRATVTVEPLDRIRTDIISTRAYDALIFSQALGPDPDPFPFWHSSQIRPPGLNLTAFVDKQADRLLEEARGTLDHAVRAQKYAAFQRILADDRPALFIATSTYTYAVASSISGVRIGQLTQPSDRFATVTGWYSETKRVRK